MSRPRIKPYGSFNVYLYREQLDWISKEVHRKKINRSELLRQIIEKEMDMQKLLYLSDKKNDPFATTA